MRGNSPGGGAADRPVGLVRYAIGARAVLAPFAPDVNRNFELWLGPREAGRADYSDVQMEWLRLMKDFVANNVEVTVEDVREASDFAALGGTAERACCSGRAVAHASG